MVAAKHTTAKHTMTAFPASRLATIDLGKVGRAKHHVVALVELDVTQALEQVREQRQHGKDVSFFTWFVATVSRTIAQEPAVHSLRAGRTSLVTFDDVDVSAIVEREVDGKKVPLPVLIRACDKKRVEEIYAEVEAAKSQLVSNRSDFVLGNERRRRWGVQLYYALPSWLRVPLLRWLTKDPFRSQQEMGTVAITSLGSIAKLPGWFIPRSIHNLCFAVGAIVRKPWIVEERIEARDILHLTILFDHDVIDGAPAARFLSQLAQNLKSAS